MLGGRIVIPGNVSASPNMNETPNDDTTTRYPARVESVWQRFGTDRRGAVFVEFLIALLPVQVFFLCLIQSSIIYSVRLATAHAAVNGARAAAVVIGDEKLDDYGQDKQHEMADSSAGTASHREVIRNAALLTLAPMILRGMIMKVDVLYPEADKPDGEDRRGVLRFTPMGERSVSKIRVRVEVEAACRIGFASQIVCSSLAQRIAGSQLNRIWLPTRTVRAEAIYPYQGARYDYED